MAITETQLEEEFVKIHPTEIILKLKSKVIDSTLKIASVFQITNISKETKIVFKLKTNQPKLYQLKPAVGLINPGESINIKVYFALNRIQIDSLYIAKHCLRVDSFKITQDITLMTDIKQLINNIQSSTKKQSNKINIIFKTTNQEEAFSIQTENKVKQSYENMNKEEKNDWNKTLAYLNLLNTQLGDITLKHQQLQKETQKDKTVMQTNLHIIKSKNETTISFSIVFVVCFLAFTLGYYLTK